VPSAAVHATGLPMRRTPWPSASPSESRLATTQLSLHWPLDQREAYTFTSGPLSRLPAHQKEIRSPCGSCASALACADGTPFGIGIMVWDISTSVTGEVAQHRP
jgi:hypothetical protein